MEYDFNMPELYSRMNLATVSAKPCRAFYTGWEGNLCLSNAIEYIGASNSSNMK